MAKTTPKSKGATPKQAAKRAAPVAPKRKAAVKRKAAPKRARAPVVAAATEEQRRALGAAVRASRAIADPGPSQWKANRHGYSEGAVSCYSCSWFQPYINEVRGGIGPIIQGPVGASQIGWCRAASVPITNLNMAVFYDTKSGSFRTSGYDSAYVTGTETLTEVIVYDATEFWCRIWTRTLNPFPWPPVYIPPPPVPNGGP